MVGALKPDLRIPSCMSKAGGPLGSGPRVGGSNPLAPTNFLRNITEFSRLDHSGSPERSVPQIARCASFQTQKTVIGSKSLGCC
jgi:hypothetical protein